MTENTQSTTETPTQRLARSLFGFSLLLFIPAVMVLIAFMTSPVSPDATFAQLRTVIIIVFAMVVLFLLGLCVQSLRLPMSSLETLTERLAKFLPLTFSAILFILVIEVNFIAGVMLINVAPDFVQPARFLLACWTVVYALVFFTLHWDQINNWFNKNKNVWLAIGISMVAFVFFGALYLLTSVVVNTSGIANTLRGGLDYRPLAFVDEGRPPTSQEFFLEQSQTTVRWSPYTYWVVDEFDGEYINIDSSGIRYTPTFSESSDATKIYVFGGSTVWGEGARDEYTIPSWLARQLDENDQDIQVINYGQTGYVSTQDMLMFQFQLRQGNIPDVAIFYQGFNDTLAAYGGGYVGITLQENQRLNDSEAGRALRNGQPVFTVPNQSLDNLDLSLLNAQTTTSQGIFDHWLANVQMINALADAYDVQTLFVWQPAIFYKTPITSDEQGILDRLERERPDFLDLYQSVDALVREYVEQSDEVNLLILSDLFANDNRTIFHDLVHITEQGNGVVVENMVTEVINLISD